MPGISKFDPNTILTVRRGYEASDSFSGFLDWLSTIEGAPSLTSFNIFALLIDAVELPVRAVSEIRAWQERVTATEDFDERMLLLMRGRSSLS
jgi:hypothetical protein